MRVGHFSSVCSLAKNAIIYIKGAFQIGFQARLALLMSFTKAACLEKPHIVRE